MIESVIVAFNYEIDIVGVSWDGANRAKPLVRGFAIELCDGLHPKPVEEFGLRRRHGSNTDAFFLCDAACCARAGKPDLLV